jgi:hypothetical protein
MERSVVVAILCASCASLSLSQRPAAAVAHAPLPSHAPAQAGSASSTVWVTDSLAKVQPGDLPGNAQSATLAAARNEWQSFQIYVRTGPQPVAMNVAVSDLVERTTGATIASASNIFVSREAYLDITELSDQNGRLGWTPDPLIPTVDPYVHEPRTAFPYTVPANTTQGAWIDVLVPLAAPPGTYKGRATISNGSQTLASIPVSVKVWAFALPSTASLGSAFGVSWDGLCVQAYGGYDRCRQYPGSGGSNDTAVELTHVAEATFFLDHRVTLSEVVYYGPSNNDWTHFDSIYAPLLDGTAPTLLGNAALTELEYTHGGKLNARNISDWTNHFSAKGWLPRLFDYTCDEPPAGCTWQQALRWGDFVHQASSDQMRTLLTTNIDQATRHNLLDAIDILTPVVDAMQPMGRPNQRKKYDAWLSEPNKHLWWYQSCDEHETCSNGHPGPKSSTWPSYMVDAAPVRNRVFQWMAFLYGIQSELYYQTDYCWTSKRCAGRDPWTSVYAFGGNGDGTLMYPGTPAKIGGTTPIPVSSIRLDLIRDGMQDFEYLAALQQAGEGKFAERVARTFITNAYTFDSDPTALQAARRRLGERLNALVSGTRASAPRMPRSSRR